MSSRRGGVWGDPKVRMSQDLLAAAEWSSKASKLSFCKAAELISEVIPTLPPDKPRIRSLLASQVVHYYLLAQDPSQAVEKVQQFLAQPPSLYSEKGRKELEGLLNKAVACQRHKEQWG